MAIKKLQNDFTTPEQSKRLLELGLSQDSANMILDGYIDSANRWVPDQYPRYLEHPYSVEIKNESELYTSNVLPCWSVGRLIEIAHICSDSTLSYKEEANEIQKFKEEHKCETLIEAVIMCIADAASIGGMDFSKLEEDYGRRTN